MTTPSTTARVGESGFVLVGVVIMALALTILGLSLFTLSNYESQFLDRSLAQCQAENKALGELERAKLRLTTSPYLLENVQAISLLDPSVTAMAKQTQGIEVDSTGPVDWEDGEEVSIEVTATVGGVTRSVTGKFNFAETPNFYKRLVTTPGKLIVETELGTRAGTVRLVDWTGGTSRYSRVSQDVQTAADTAWTLDVEDYTHGIKPRIAPPPDVDAFILQTANDTPQGTFPGPGESRYAFVSPLGEVGFFRHPDPSPGGFTFASSNEVTLDVKGHVVWLVSNGVHMSKTLHVTSPDPGNSSLTIVASRYFGPADPAIPIDAGIWLDGGITETPTNRVPVFLVSDANVYIEQHDSSSEPTSLSSLSVFAANVNLLGPLSGQPNRMSLSYDRSTNALVDWLSEKHALPNTSPGGNHRLALVPGTWKMRAR